MVQILVPLTLFTIMFALGMGLRSDAPALLRRRPALLLRVVIGSCVLVPLVALLLLHLPLSHVLSPPARFALALMALCPSAPLALRKAGRQGGDRELAAVLQVLAALSAIITVPLLADAFRVTYDVAGWNIRHDQVAGQVALAQVLPLLLGLGLRRWQPGLAARLSGPLDRLANGLIVVLTLLVLLIAGPKLLTFLSGNLMILPFIAALVFASLAIGWLVAGPGQERRERITTALVTSMRNPGLALLLATRYGADIPGLKIGILLYVLMTLLLSVPFLRRARALDALAEAGQGIG